MKVLLVGVGTVGEAIARLSAGRPWLEQMVLAGRNLDRVREVADTTSSSVTVADGSARSQPATLLCPQTRGHARF